MPGRGGSIHISFTRLGIRSVFPPSSGTQKLWFVSAESSFRNVGVGCSGSLAGMCISFAVTMPSLGYRNSHQYWCPIAVISSAVAGLGASWIAWITRAVARNSTATIKTGITVHANSICVLPYTCAGSRSACSPLDRNLTTAQTNNVKTTTKISPVTTSTNSDNPKMLFAGVDAGAKIFVGLNGAFAGSANAADARQNKNTKMVRNTGVFLCLLETSCTGVAISPADIDS